ncbi:hypothetical protein ACKVMT_00335 [Halobacteriales archaeon Cl-PHB]
MPQTRNGSNGDRQPEDDRERSGQGTQQRHDDGMSRATRWFAGTAVRAGLTVIGVVLLLFALGQAVGLPLLELTTDALTTQTGQWLAVAFFAVLLIGAAQKVTPTG